MIERLDPVIDTLKALRLTELSATETGWVLRHVYGLPMPDAVHIASALLSEQNEQNQQAALNYAWHCFGCGKPCERCGSADMKV